MSDDASVICGDCKHLYQRYSGSGKLYAQECRHPSLTWHRRNPIDGTEMNSYSNPMSVNADLDCELHEPRR